VIRWLRAALALFRKFCESMYFWPQDYDNAVEDAVTALAGEDRDGKS